MAESKNEKLVKVIAYLKQRLPSSKVTLPEDELEEDKKSTEPEEEQPERSISPDRLVNKKRVSEFLKNFLK